jgi:hypothetical protein
MPEDDEPTKPEASSVSQATLMIARLFDGLDGHQKARLAALVKAWSKCTLDQQVILEALARELAPPDS